MYPMGPSSSAMTRLKVGTSQPRWPAAPLRRIWHDRGGAAPRTSRSPALPASACYRPRRRGGRRQQVIDQRAMACHLHHEAARLRVADPDLLHALPDHGVGRLAVHVALRADVVGDPPGEVAVATQGEPGHADEPGTYRLERATRQVNLVEGRRGLVGHVRIARQASACRRPCASRPRPSRCCRPAHARHRAPRPCRPSQRRRPPRPVRPPAAIRAIPRASPREARSSSPSCAAG